MPLLGPPVQNSCPQCVSPTEARDPERQQSGRLSYAGQMESRETWFYEVMSYVGEVVAAQYPTAAAHSLLLPVNQEHGSNDITT